jgi:hypothetical protein
MLPQALGGSGLWSCRKDDIDERAVRMSGCPREPGFAGRRTEQVISEGVPKQLRGWDLVILSVGENGSPTAMDCFKQ